jgi:hypothetical protein
VEAYDALIRSKLHELGEMVVLDIDSRRRRRELSCHVRLLIHSGEGRDADLAPRVAPLLRPFHSDTIVSLCMDSATSPGPTSTIN